MVRYIVTAIIYLTAMSAIDEDLIPDALSPLGTVAAYTYFTGILVTVLFGFPVPKSWHDPLFTSGLAAQVYHCN